MAIFGSFIGLQSILYAELMVDCGGGGGGLELIAHLCYFVLEVGLDSATVVSWIYSWVLFVGIFLIRCVGCVF